MARLENVEKLFFFCQLLNLKLVPKIFDVNPLPNLGPKVNHHFRLNNSVFIEMEHPT